VRIGSPQVLPYMKRAGAVIGFKERFQARTARIDTRKGTVARDDCASCDAENDRSRQAPVTRREFANVKHQDCRSMGEMRPARHLFPMKTSRWQAHKILGLIVLGRNPYSSCSLVGREYAFNSIMTS
jgi:hypothetical protein